MLIFFYFFWLKNCIKVKRWSNIIPRTKKKKLFRSRVCHVSEGETESHSDEETQSPRIWDTSKEIFLPFLLLVHCISLYVVVAGYIELYLLCCNNKGCFAWDSRLQAEENESQSKASGCFYPWNSHRCFGFMGRKAVR